VSWWLPGDWSKRINNVYFNGSLGNGGYNRDWRREYVDIWDQIPAGYPRRAGFVGASPTYTNQTFFFGAVSVPTDIQVWVDPVIYYCFRHRSDGYYDGLGNYYPPVTHYTRAEYHIDYLSYIQHAGDC